MTVVSLTVIDFTRMRVILFVIEISFRCRTRTKKNENKTETLLEIFISFFLSHIIYRSTKNNKITV